MHDVGVRKPPLTEEEGPAGQNPGTTQLKFTPELSPSEFNFRPRISKLRFCPNSQQMGPTDGRGNLRQSKADQSMEGELLKVSRPQPKRVPGNSGTSIQPTSVLHHPGCWPNPHFRKFRAHSATQGQECRSGLPLWEDHRRSKKRHLAKLRSRCPPYGTTLRAWQPPRCGSAGILDILPGVFHQRRSPDIGLPTRENAPEAT